MIGPFGHETMDDYARQHKTLLAPSVCMCPDCLNAEISLPSILVFEGKRLRDIGGKEVWVSIGRWLHGTERKVYAELRERARAAVESAEKAHTLK